MRIATKIVTDPITGLTRTETLIQTELGTYYILDEDASSDEVRTRRVTSQEALEFRRISSGSAVPTGTGS